MVCPVVIISDITIIFVWLVYFCLYKCIRHCKCMVLICYLLLIQSHYISDFAIVWFRCVTFCWNMSIRFCYCIDVLCYRLFILVYQILLLYWCGMLPFVYTSVLDITIVLVWYVTFCWYMIIRFFSCIDVICYLLFILVYQILLCVGVICAIVDISDILFGVILFESVYCCDILKCWFAYASIYLYLYDFVMTCDIVYISGYEVNKAHISDV